MTGKFVFCVKNISLTITHMLVRHRFFSILQKSTAVNDLRDENFVMPRSFNKDPKFYKKVKDWYLQGKELFCEAVDKQNISVQNARLFIPKNNCNHMFIGCDLKSFREAYGQRADTCEEPIQSNLIFEKMKELIVEKFPYFESYIKSNCDTGRCLHCGTGKHSNIVFKRDEKHKVKNDKYDSDIMDDTLHDMTRDEMNEGPEIKEEIIE